ncbi:MAG TPA: prolipoprotein diacylglyceryl transferase, partial [Ktedonobacteraceae bacterium]|nr:prolipoprotein diacylglyceryl transferase [Ktedonobacteraceae bacterium]
FFARANTVVPLFTLDWGLKQAQWTSLIVLLLLIPLTVWMRHWRFARPVPAGELPATYAMPPSRSKAVSAPIEEETSPVSHPR